MHDLTEKTTFVGEAQERWNKLDGEQKSLESQINAIEATEKLNTEMRESKNGHKETAQPGADTRSNAQKTPQQRAHELRASAEYTKSFDTLIRTGRAD
jgi:septal ring factor EnvC (AmiA/AmiB activator)